GFKKVSYSEINSGEVPYTDAKKSFFNYEIANTDEFSPIENNFIIKEEIAGPVSIIEGGVGGIFKEISGKIIYMSGDNTKPYKLNDIGDVEALNLKNALVSFNKNGEIISINGLSDEASMQKVVPIIDDEEILNMDIPLKRTEKLTFKGMTEKDKFDIAKPIFEVYELDEKQNFNQWLETLGGNYKTKEDGWWLELCEDEIGPLAFWYYAPGSKFQIIPAKDGTGCSISHYELTTEKDERKLPRKPYICGEIEYYAEPGKLKELFCNTKESILRCIAEEEPCTSSELTWVDKTGDNEIELGTNDFTASKFVSIKKIGEEEFELDADELKLYSDYIFPGSTGKVTVTPGKLITPEREHITLKAEAETVIIRKWIDKNVKHVLRTDISGKPVNYMISVFRGSTDNPARIDAIYPDYYSVLEHDISLLEKGIYTIIYGSAPQRTEGETIKLDETSILASSRVNRLPTFGIKIKTEILLGQSPDVNYYAIPRQDLKGRGEEEVVSETNSQTVYVTKGQSIYDVISKYCFKKDSSSEDITPEQDSAVRKIADTILTEAGNDDSPNNGFFKTKSTEEPTDPVFRGTNTEYVTTLKEGDLTLPGSEDIIFLGESDFQIDDPGVTIHGRNKCSIERTSIGDIFHPKKKTGSKLQTCGSNCYAVQTGDTINRIWEKNCKAEMKYPEFRKRLFELNPKVNSRPGSAWKDKIWPGDKLNLPECAEKNLTSEELLELPLEAIPECPTQDSNCQTIKLEGPQGVAYRTGYERSCENAFPNCDTSCKWYGKVFGAKMEFCRLNKETTTNKQLSKANEKLEEKKKKGFYVENLIGRLLFPGSGWFDEKEEESSCPQNDRDCDRGVAALAGNIYSKEDCREYSESLLPSCTKCSPVVKSGVVTCVLDKEELVGNRI
ncbi:MAG: hypothetical protein ABIH53_03185, partial [archaeon]